MNKVVVVGSLSQDMVVKTPRRPSVGETVRGTDFQMFAGGKGNNQALSAARAGADVVMIGRVGDDSFGQILIDKLEQERVRTEFMFRDADKGTGVAVIVVDDLGNNSIIIAQQANLNLSVEDVHTASDAIASGDVLLMQLEIPTSPVYAAAKIAYANKTTVILNPAPAPDDITSLSADLLSMVDIFVPNQSEAQMMTGIEVIDKDAAEAASLKLRALGPRTIILTMGEIGVYVLHEERSVLIPAFKVRCVDSTAAGDAFCGALAASLAGGTELFKAVEVASAAGALATTRFGAEPSLPTAREIRSLMADWPVSICE